MVYVHCTSCPLRRQPIFHQFSEDELAFVSELKSGQIRLEPHEHIVSAGDNGNRLYTLLAGWAFRYMTLPRGRRQILDFLLPGSLIGLQSPLTGRVAHSVCTITPALLCVLDGERFPSIFPKHPGLSASLVGMLLSEQDRADTRLLLLGRQRPTERLAYLLLDLRWRLKRRDMMDGECCELPLTYDIMADAAGMSRSQLAHSLAELRSLGWASMQHGLLCFQDVESMSSACAFVPPPADRVRTIL